METRKVLPGLSTTSFYAPDHQAAIKWSFDFFGIEPYFNVPGYAEFGLGDYQHELGSIASKFAPYGVTVKPTGTIAYRHVDDLQATFDKLASLGTSMYEPIIDRSQGQRRFITASVIDPFCNILGIITNKHDLEILQNTIQ